MALGELTYHVLTSDPEIDAIAGEWQDLHRRAGGSAYLRYECFRAWWDTLAKPAGLHLHVVVGREGARLIGILPLAVMKRYGMRILFAAGHKVYHYCDMLAENKEQASGLWKAAQNSAGYDFADIRDVYPESPCYQALESFACKRDKMEAFRLRIQWPAADAWLATLSDNMKNQLKRRMRRLEEIAPVRFEVYEKGPLPKDIIDNMVREKIEWAERNDKQGLFMQKGVSQYFHRLAEALAANGQLFLAWLKCGDEVIASEYSIVDNGILRGYVGSYSSASAKFSPGILIIIRSTQWAIDKGMRVVDHGHGDGGYKRRLSNETSHCMEFTFAGSLKGRIMESVFFLLRGLSRFVRRKGHGGETLAGNESAKQKVVGK